MIQKISCQLVTNLWIPMDKTLETRSHKFLYKLNAYEATPRSWLQTGELNISRDLIAVITETALVIHQFD
jgi:hypothetical protein